MLSSGGPSDTTLLEELNSVLDSYFPSSVPANLKQATTWQASRSAFHDATWQWRLDADFALRNLCSDAGNWLSLCGLQVKYTLT